jgi:cytochrome c-type biogenesis protein
MTLLLASFLAGILTILAPCVLPVLPVILAGSLSEKKRWYPYVVVFSLAISIVVFTGILKVSTLLIDVPQSFWKYLSGWIVLLLGIITLFPSLWARIVEKFRLSRTQSGLQNAQDIDNSFLRAIVTGSVLGPVFSTCSPTYTLLLATVFPVSFLAWIGYIFVYALGLSCIMLLIVMFGRNLVKKLWILADERWIFKKMLGWVFIVVSVFIVTWLDKVIETALLEKFDVSGLENALLNLLNL